MPMICNGQTAGVAAPVVISLHFALSEYSMPAEENCNKCILQSYNSFYSKVELILAEVYACVGGCACDCNLCSIVPSG